MEEIDKLASDVRESISDYCINECHAFCCREGFLKLKQNEVELYCRERKDLLISEDSLKEMWNGKYLLNFKNSLEGCPQLKNWKCMIHKDIGRSNTCKDFPIFILGKQIKISNRCPAKKEGKFFGFEKDAIAEGFEIVDDFF